MTMARLVPIRFDPLPLPQQLKAIDPMAAVAAAPPCRQSAELQRALGGGGGGGGENEQKQQEAAARREMILGSVLTAEAKERLARIAIVKPDKAREVGDMLIGMAQRGQISERISEDRLKGMLTGIEGAKKETKIKFQRKRYGDDDDDDDYSDL